MPLRPHQRAAGSTPRRAAWLLAGVLAALSTTLLAAPTAASATPPSGITAQELGVVTVGATTITARKITFDPGGTTGWHSHEGPVYALLTQGNLQRTLGDCTTVTSAPGDVIAEQPGPHVGTAQGPEPVILWTLYVDPAGAPLADDAPAIDCNGD